MENLFAAFSHEDSIVFLLSVLICFLIGFITGWILYAGRARRYRKEAEQWKRTHDDLSLHHKVLREEFDLKEADLVLAQREAKDAKEHSAALQAEKARWQKDLDTAIEDSVKAHSSISSYQTTIDDLNSQILGLKALNAELTTAVGASGETAITHHADHDATVKRLNEMEAKLSALSVESTGGDADATKRLESLEKKIDALAAENAVLKTQLTTQSNGNGNDGSDDIYGAVETADVDKGETTTLTAVEARNEIMAANGDKWPVATEAEKDDLTRINGVGSFLEKKMNDLGIYTYEQLRWFTPYWVERLTAAIEFFPGRIERDDWIGQARRLQEIKSENPEALEASAVFSTNLEDLKTVEGIGPKIEELLKENGIPDLLALSNTKDTDLRKILEAAGSRFKMHDPTTWPVQAELAQKGEWGTLKKLQDKLKGGKEV